MRREQGELVTGGAQTEQATRGYVTQVTVATEFLPSENVAQVNFDKGYGDT